jgi:hypothetical protein
VQVVEDALVFSERKERIPQIKAQINGLLARFACLRQMRKDAERLFKACHGFPVGGPGERLGSRLLAVGESLVPHLAPHGVLRQEVHLLVQPVAGQRLQGLHNAGMQAPAAALAGDRHRPPRASGRA